MAKQAKSKTRKKPSEIASGKEEVGLFSLEEIERLKTWAFASCLRGERSGALLVALLGTGGRRFEVAALRCGDVRQGAGGYEVYFPEVKGGGSATVPITDNTYQALRVWCGDRVAADPLIHTEDGEFMHVATLWRTFRAALLEAGVSRSVGVHASRHAAGFLLLRATNDITKVQKFLRHKSLNTTASWYTHVHMPDLRAGMSKAGL